MKKARQEKFNRRTQSKDPALDKMNKANRKDALRR